MKATFKGVPGEQHASIHMYGQDFPLGKAVEVTSPQAMRKLIGHPHFDVTREASDDKEGQRVEQEFKASAAAALADQEALHQQEERDAVARSQSANRDAGITPSEATNEAVRANQESNDGRTQPERAGQPSAAQAAGSRSGGSRRGS